MAIGLGALQTVLEEGNKDDWFGSPFIVRLPLVAAVALPAVRLDRAHARRIRCSTCACCCAAISASASLAMFLLGVALYGSVFILPVYLARVQGYNAEQIGMVLAWTGLPQLLLIPLVPRLMRRFDAALHRGAGLRPVRRSATS